MDYRKWLDTRGGHGPFGPLKDVMEPLSKEVLTDRKSQHTDQCPSCTAVRPPPDMYASGIGLLASMARTWVLLFIPLEF